MYEKDMYHHFIVFIASSLYANETNDQDWSVNINIAPCHGSLPIELFKNHYESYSAFQSIYNIKGIEIKNKNVITLERKNRFYFKK